MAHPEASEQSAELRQAFLKHLPKRMDTLVRRGQRLLIGGWDINTLIRLYQEVQTLAGACGRYGILDAGELLFGIERMLAPSIQQVQLPDEEATRNFGKLLNALAGLVARSGAPSLPALAALGTGTGRQDPDRARYPNAVSPPPRYWQRWRNAPLPTGASLAASPAIVAAEPRAAEPAGAHAPTPPRPPTPAPVATTAPARTTPQAASPQEKRILHLSVNDALAQFIDRELAAENYPLEMLESIDELKEYLSAFAPAMVIVDAAFGEGIETIGEALRLVRSRATGRVALVVLSTSADIAVRLRAMRAGADAFIALPQPESEVIARIRELLDADSKDPYRVLIIEDDRSQAMFAESILRKAGMLTRSVHDPLTALAELDGFDPELILMDLYMPDCDGMELTTLIREREAFVNVPIVFLSGEHDEEKRFDALSAGGDDYLEKPIRPKHLISAVTNRVRRTRANQRRQVAHNPQDPMTGLYDRAHVLDRVSEAMAQDDLTQGGVLFLLLEGAQAVREQVGLLAFDQLVGQAGAFLAQRVPKTALPARYGDTSFFLLVPDADEAAMLALAANIHQAFVEHLFELGERSTSLAVSVGAALFAQNFGDAADVLNAAERACAQARSSPDRKVALYHAPVDSAEGDETGVVELIRNALKHDQFQLLFQPIAALRGSGDAQFEVLLRLRGDGGKLYTGSALMPIAERAGLVQGIDRWVLSRALMVISERARDGQVVHLFVSQSIDSAADPQRASWLKQMIDTRGASARQLVLQLRAPDAVARVRQTATFVEQIKALGVQVCFTQFEPTMANFQMLQHIPVDLIKIAPRFTGSEGQNPKVRAELRQTITTAREHGVRVVAPRVEDAQCAAALWSTGVDYIQGNFVQAATQELNFDFAAAAM
ncbi:MAG: EAL domain-containing protein [Lysobacterales bacterium]